MPRVGTTEIRMAPVFDRNGWLAVFGSLVHGNGGGDLLLYVQVTRGAEFGRNHPFPATATPTVFAFASPYPLPAAATLERGLRAHPPGSSAHSLVAWIKCSLQ